jgi:hypothetical protein
MTKIIKGKITDVRTSDANALNLSVEESVGLFQHKGLITLSVSPEAATLILHDHVISGKIKRANGVGEDVLLNFVSKEKTEIVIRMNPQSVLNVYQHLAGVKRKGGGGKGMLPLAESFKKYDLTIALGS